jgi:acetyl-CoA carboxylase alpha subunit
LTEPPKDPLSTGPAWDSIMRSRRPDRPGVRELLSAVASSVVPLWGTGRGESDASMVIALAKLGSIPCLVIGQDRGHQTAVRPLGTAAGLRIARRGMHLAQELRLPLLTVIDTAGVELSREAEEGAVAGEIARCLADLVTLDTPTVSFLLGEGAGGGALALMPADRVVGAQHSWLSPLPPEGASAILYRDTSRAPAMADAQRVHAVALLELGVVDRIVSERPDAADERDAFFNTVSHVLQYEFGRLVRQPSIDRLQRRRARYRAL